MGTVALLDSENMSDRRPYMVVVYPFVFFELFFDLRGHFKETKGGGGL
jgi:hypothetical protein